MPLRDPRADGETDGSARLGSGEAGLEGSLMCPSAAPAAPLLVTVQVRQNVTALANAPSFDELPYALSPKCRVVTLELVVSGHGQTVLLTHCEAAQIRSAGGCPGATLRRIYPKHEWRGRCTAAPLIAHPLAHPLRRRWIVSRRLRCFLPSADARRPSRLSGSASHHPEAPPCTPEPAPARDRRQASSPASSCPDAEPSSTR